MRVQDRWAGGRRRQDREGGSIFIIEKMVRGTPYYLTLDVKDEEDALIELRDFKKDPAAYKVAFDANRGLAASPVAAPNALVLDAALINDFAGFLEKSKIKKTGSGCTPVYVADAERYLLRWSTWLNGQDLRSVDASSALQWLSKDEAREKRIKFIRALCTWLVRMDGRMKPHENWTLGIPSQQAGSRKAGGAVAYVMEDVEELYRRLETQIDRDILQFLARWGVHYTEVGNLAAGGALGSISAMDDSPGIAALVRFWHKNGYLHPLLVDAQGLAAAKRLQVAGKLPDVKATTRKFLRRCGYLISQGNKLTGVDGLRTGRLLPKMMVALFRHSFLSWRAQGKKVAYRGKAGLSIEDMTVVTGHSMATAKKHYDLTRVPPFMVLLPLKLRHPDDPDFR